VSEAERPAPGMRQGCRSRRRRGACHRPVGRFSGKGADGHHPGAARRRWGDCRDAWKRDEPRPSVGGGGTFQASATTLSAGGQAILSMQGRQQNPVG